MGVGRRVQTQRQRDLTAGMHALQAVANPGHMPRVDCSQAGGIAPAQGEIRRERFNTPLILFQGAQDLITPPNQAQLIRDALRGRGLPVVYHEFADEGHGFRRAESIFDAINMELHFYQTILGLRTEP
jgi:dienelactone hydrolase